MRDIQKFTNVLAILAIFAMALMPMIAAAQGDIFGTRPLPGDFEQGTNTASDLLVTILEIALGLVGLIAILFLVWGGFQYITSAGDEEKLGKAKGTMINALIGLAIVLLAYALVRIIANAVLSGGSDI
jgi:cytosine/uracil/thiamine/allantoin permease